MGTCQACPHGSHQDARKVALDPARGQKLFRRAPQPAVAIATSETLLQQRLKNAWCAVRVVPDQVLGVKLGPVFLKNSETRLEFPPHFRLRMRRDDGYLRGVEFKRCQRAQIFRDGFRRLWRQANDVVALRVQAGEIQLLRQLKGGLDFLVLVHLLQDVLMKAFNAEQRALHAAVLPLVEIAKKQVHPGLYQPAYAMARKQLDNLFRVRRQVAKIFIEQQHEMDAVLHVEIEHAVERSERDGFRFRGKNRGLAERTGEAAAARGEQHPNGKRPSTGETKFRYQWRMLNFIERNAKPLRDRFFAVARKNAIEIRLDRRRESAVVAGPKLGDAGQAGFRGHFQNIVGFFEIEREPNDIPAALQVLAVFSARGVLENLDTGNVLPQEAQAKRNAPGHAKAPPEVARGVLAEIVVQSRVSATSSEQNPRHEPLLLRIVLMSQTRGGRKL